MSLAETRAMVQGMRPGSVVVDLAAESGGNVEGSMPGRDIHVPTADGRGTVTLVGLKDAPSAMAADASRLYAKNVANLLALMTCDGTVAPDFDDDVVAGACLTHDGAVRHPPTAEAIAAIAGQTAHPAPEAHPEETASPEETALPEQAEPPEGELSGEKASENEGVA